MKLTQNQIDFYNENGYLVIEDLISDLEIEKLQNATKKFNSKITLPNVICEDDGEIRSVFAPHVSESIFEDLYRDERLSGPAKQLIGNSVYLYQFKLNKKRALTGQMWEWHQDFPFWCFDDGVKEPKMMSVMILFQDTRMEQGPLMVVPGSHKNGIADMEHKEHLHSKKNDEIDLLNSLNTDLKYTIKSEIVKESTKKNEVVFFEGNAGTCIFFHPNLFHASQANFSPFERDTGIVTYNDINNIPKETENMRPDYLCSRNFESINS
jgi:ectoine hydroxylase